MKTYGCVISDVATDVATDWRHTLKLNFESKNNQLFKG